MLLTIPIIVPTPYPTWSNKKRIGKQIKVMFRSLHPIKAIMLMLIFTTPYAQQRRMVGHLIENTVRTIETMIASTNNKGTKWYKEKHHGSTLSVRPIQ